MIIPVLNADHPLLSNYTITITNTHIPTRDIMSRSMPIKNITLGCWMLCEKNLVHGWKNMGRGMEVAKRKRGGFMFGRGIIFGELDFSVIAVFSY
jgi:hypothetical protein